MMTKNQVDHCQESLFQAGLTEAQESEKAGVPNHTTAIMSHASILTHAIVATVPVVLHLPWPKAPGNWDR